MSCATEDNDSGNLSYQDRIQTEAKSLCNCDENKKNPVQDISSIYALYLEIMKLKENLEEYEDQFYITKQSLKKKSVALKKLKNDFWLLEQKAQELENLTC